MIGDKDKSNSDGVNNMEKLLRETGIDLGRTLHLGVCTGISFQEVGSEDIKTVEYETSRFKLNEIQYMVREVI